MKYFKGWGDNVHNPVTNLKHKRKSATRPFWRNLRANLQQTRETGQKCCDSFFINVTFFIFQNFHNRFFLKSQNAQPQPKEILAKIAEDFTLTQFKPPTHSQTFSKFPPEKILNSFCRHFVEISMTSFVPQMTTFISGRSTGSIPRSPTRPF